MLSNLRQLHLFQQCGTLAAEYLIIRGSIDQVRDRAQGVIPQPCLSIDRGNLRLLRSRQFRTEGLGGRNPFDSPAGEDVS